MLRHDEMLVVVVEATPEERHARELPRIVEAVGIASKLLSIDAVHRDRLTLKDNVIAYII